MKVGDAIEIYTWRVYKLMRDKFQLVIFYVANIRDCTCR